MRLCSEDIIGMSTYLVFATPNNGFCKLLHEPSNVRYRDLVQAAGPAGHVNAAGLPVK